MEGFFLLGRDEGLGALEFFIWAAIGLKYHPASRLVWWASKRGALKKLEPTEARQSGSAANGLMRIGLDER